VRRNSLFRALTIAGTAALVLLAAGCNKSEDPGESAKARVTPKSGQVWAQDLANGLGLEAWELCAELGSYDCVSEAHLITLGGVEPTRLGIDEPSENASVSAPIAVDRVATAACGERYARDVDAGADGAVIFGAVLDKDRKRKREEVAENLVRRLLARHPTKEEVDGLMDFYKTIEDISDDPVRDWSIGACVVVATSTEALFY